MNSEFATQKLNILGQQRADLVRDAFDDLLNRLRRECPSDGRYFAIVKTKLEEACMFAIKAISSDQANQFSDPKN